MAKRQIRLSAPSWQFEQSRVVQGVSCVRVRMSTRIRKPSAKLLEIAGQYAASSHSMLPPPVPASPSQKPKKKGTSTTTNAAGQRKSSTTAGKSTAGPQKPAKKAAATQFEGPGQDGHRLYCICLGTDDQTPMIQCEGCENWCVSPCLPRQMNGQALHDLMH